MKKENQVQQSTIENHLTMIFRLYETALEIATKEIKTGDMEQSIKKSLVENIISNQKQKLKDEMALLLKDEYFVIDRPYGILVYSSGLDQQISIDKYLAEFYLNTTREVIQILG